jgi:glycogen operon protein
MRNFLATLLLSQGVPMLCAGDEVARTQGGNNNAYCQDNEISWFPWSRRAAAERQLEFTRRLIRLRRDNPVFRRRTFFQGRRLRSGADDLSWVRPDGKEMIEEEWTNGFGRCLGLVLVGDAIGETGDGGEPVGGDTFLVLLNAHHETLPFILPAHGADSRWTRVLDTRDWETDDHGPGLRAGEPYDLGGRTLAVLRLARGSGTRQG